jgi:hypothetical protein
MTKDVGSAHDRMIWLKGHTFPGQTAARSFTAKLVLLPVAVIIGIVAWTMLPGPSDAEIQPVLARSQLYIPAQNTSWFNPAITPTETTLVTPVQETVPPDATAADGLKISSQSWRRGGLGSNALVTFTLRNSNGYAVRDIEISCAFTRRDGSHLTDRSRTIHDTVNMKSRKTFARMHIGFVNVYADRAKCSPVTASRI